MRMSRMSWAVAVAALIAAGAIGLAQLPGLIRGSLNHYQQAAYMKLGNYPVAGEALYASLEPFDYSCMSTGWWEQRQCAGLRQGAQKKNPRHMTGSYLTVFAIAEWEYAAHDTMLVKDWAVTMDRFLAMTTEGDTARIYPKARVINYFLPGAIDSARAVWARHLNQPEARDVQWFMLDFCSSPLPDMLPPGGDPQQHGLMDLDQDGIDHWHDADEKARWRQVNFELVRILDQIRPSAYFIPNGQLAIIDPEFSREVDGCYVEGFPQWFFGGAYRIDNALDPEFAHSIPNLVAPGRFKAVPGYIMVEDRYDSGIPGYLSALFDGVIEVRRSHNDVTPPAKPLDLRRLGAPRGPAAISDRLISRQFEHGTVSLRVNSATSVTPMVTQ